MPGARWAAPGSQPWILTSAPLVIIHNASLSLGFFNLKEKLAFSS